MPITVIVAVLVFTLGLSHCRASLGENMDQCVLRFGKPMPSSGVADQLQLGGIEAVFQKNNYEFKECFINGGVESETITKKDHSSFTDKEREELLQNEVGGGVWSNPITKSNLVARTRPDGAAFAYFVTSPEIIYVSSRKYRQLEHEKSLASFPTEKEVRSNIKVGMDEKDVIQKFGVPGRRNLLKDGELLSYDAPPTREKETFAYAGFEIFIKNGRVTNLEFIHRTQ